MSHSDASEDYLKGITTLILLTLFLVLISSQLNYITSGPQMVLNEAQQIQRRIVGNIKVSSDPKMSREVSLDSDKYR